MSRRITTLVARVAPLLVCTASHAQFADNFDDGDLAGWTAITDGTATVSNQAGELEIGGSGTDAGVALLDVSLTDPEGYVAGVVSFDIELDIGGRPIEAGVEVLGDPATGAAMIFAVFNNNPGGPGATIGLREAAGGPVFKLAAPAIPFDTSRVRLRLEWTTTSYSLRISNRDQQGQSVSFDIDAPAPVGGTALSLFVRPLPSVSTDGWSAAFDNFAAIPANLLGCAADVNGDGMLSPADYNAWIIAFNTDAPECDQNGDGLCTPADYNGWIINWNAGCN